MARASGQKLKLLYLLRFLERQSDQAHPVTVPEMLRELERQGISAERKSIYDDLEALRQFGVDVVQQRGRGGGYYIGQRDFEMAELKLLVDSIQSSKFITEKKTLSLIGKLEGLTSVHEARLLERQVFVRDRVKSMNESVYYSVDEISTAISRDRQIRFRYLQVGLDKERRYRRRGAYYRVSPFSLLWDDENYYLLAWEEESGLMKHYRVDKMAQIETLEAERQGKAAFRRLDMAGYTKKVFGMFSGRERRVRLRFDESLAGAVVDRFGKDVMLVPAPQGRFTISVEVAESPQFYAWLFGFGRQVELLEPEDMRRELQARAAELAALYA